jgi:hypothetical protein
MGGWLYRWAMISGALSPIFGIGILILMLFDCCCKVCYSKFMQGFLFFCALFNQACTFLIYISTACLINGGLICKFGWGSLFSIIAFALYLFGSFFMCCSPKHDPVCCNRGDTDDGKKCCGEKDKKDEAKPAAEEQPAAEKAAETTAVAAAVVNNETEEKEETKTDVEQQPVAEEKVAAAAVASSPAEEEKEEIASSVAASAQSRKSSASALADEAETEAEEDGDLEDQIMKVSVKDEGVSVRLEDNENARDPSVPASGLEPDDIEAGHGEEPDGDKFVGKSIKAERSLLTSPW